MTFSSFGSKFWEMLEDVMGGLIYKKTKYYGKFRGIVRDNKDPLKMGRIRAEVPKVLGRAIDENQWSLWALPCIPYAGTTKGMFFTPRVGDLIWIEFEQGLLEKPVWAGMMWGAEDMTPEMNTNIPLDNTIETDNYRISLQDTNSEDDTVFPKFSIESKISGTKIEVDETMEAEKLTISQKDLLGANEQLLEMDGTLDAQKITIQDKAGSTIMLDSTSGAESIIVEEITTGNKITMDAVGMAIEATGEITIDGSASIAITSGGAGQKIAINGEDQFLAFGKLVEWCSSHKHIGNMGGPTPVFPGDLASIMPGLAPGGGFMSNNLAKTTKAGK